MGEMKCFKCCKTRSNGTPLLQNVTINLCVCFTEQRDISYATNQPDSSTVKFDDKITDASYPPAYDAICKEPASFEMNETKEEDTEFKRSINVKVQFDENRRYISKTGKKWSVKDLNSSLSGIYKFSGMMNDKPFYKHSKKQYGD